MKHKKISVITIVKNGMPFIKSTVKSFNLQNYSNKELELSSLSFLNVVSKDFIEKYTSLNKAPSI